MQKTKKKERRRRIEIATRKNKFDDSVMAVIEEAKEEKLNQKQIEKLIKMKKWKDKKYESNLTTALQNALLIEDEEYNGLSNNEVIALKVVNKVKNSKDIVKEAEILHRMVGEAKSKVDLNVEGIEEIIKPIMGEEKF